jgi:hypothetical protein
MSTKTNFKRVALVAVASLGLGVLTSVAPANAATATGQAHLLAAGLVCSANKGTTPVTLTSSVPAATTATNAEYLAGNGISVVAPLGATVQVEVDTANFATVTSGKGSVTSTTGTAALVPTANVVLVSPGADDAVTITPASVGTITVKYYGADPIATPSTPLLNSITITVVAACSSTTFSAKYSGIEVNESVWDGTAYTATPAYSSGDDLTAEAGNDLIINVLPKNAYAQTITSGNWAAQATNGATVLFGTSSAIDNLGTAAGSYSFSSSTSITGAFAVRVTPKDAAVSSTTSVTITYNGAEVTTKTLTFLGEATKIVVAANAVGKVGGQGMIWYTLQDAAGNTVPGAVTGDSTTFGPRVSNVENIASALQDSATDADTVNSIALSTLFGGASKIGVLRTTCTEGGGSGTASVTLKHTSAVNANALTLPVTVSCAGGLDTYAVSMDKAAYKVGEIATLTITAKDSKGNAVHDFTALNSSVAPDITTGGASVTKAPTTSDTFGILSTSPAGVKTYKIQMTTGGSFNAVVNLPGATTKSATTSYTVTSGDVSMSEVLKAIVSLIASINKQIAALQKALLKK